MSRIANELRAGYRNAASSDSLDQVFGIEIIEQPAAQINDGTGKDVSDDLVADAGAPLSVCWLADCFVGIRMLGP